MTGFSFSWVSFLSTVRFTSIGDGEKYCLYSDTLLYITLEMGIAALTNEGYFRYSRGNYDGVESIYQRAGSEGGSTW